MNTNIPTTFPFHFQVHKGKKMSFKDWTAFFRDAGISSSEAHTYTAAFVQHNIRSDTMEDLDKGDLRDMGITAIGDIKRILKYAKKENLAKYKTIKGEPKLISQIDGWLKSKNVKSEQVINLDDDEVMTGDIQIDLDGGNDEGIGWMEDKNYNASSPKVGTVFSVKDDPVICNQLLNSAIYYPDLRKQQHSVHGKSLSTKTDTIPSSSVLHQIEPKPSNDKKKVPRNAAIKAITTIKQLVFDEELSQKKIPSPDKSGNYHVSSTVYENLDFSKPCDRAPKKHSDRKFKCESCDKCYKSQGNLTQHVNNDHLKKNVIHVMPVHIAPITDHKL